MSHRIEKVAERIRQEASKVIQQELNDPRMKMVSVVSVEPSPDLRSAKVLYSVMGSDADVRTAQRAMDHARGRIQSIVGSRLGMKYTPKLVFILDLSIKKSVEISRLIDEALGE